MERFHIFAALFITMLLSSPATAVSVRWEVTGIFEDGGTVAGSFVLDEAVLDSATTPQEIFPAFSNFNFMTSGGDTSVFPGSTYTSVAGIFVPNSLLFGFQSNSSTGFNLRIDFDDEFRFGNSPIGVTPFSEGGPSVLFRELPPGGSISDQRNLIPSTVSANATIAPIPAAVWLFCSGLIGIIGIRRSSYLNS